MSDQNSGGPGIRNVGRALGRLGQAFFGLAEQRAAEEAAGQAIDRQELLQAQQYFRTRYNEWLANNNDTRFDQIEQSYDQFAQTFRSEVDSTSELFTSDRTAEAFSFWLDEAVSERRLPVQSQAAENRVAYHGALYESNLESAVNARDVDAVHTAIRAAVEDGVETPANAINVLEESLYTINYANIEDSLMDQAQEMGYENAVAALDDMPEGFFQFQVDVDEEGNPIYRELETDDIEAIKDRVKDALDEQRQEQEYQINRVDTAFDERANDLFTDRTLTDLFAMKRWLEGVNPVTGDPLPDSADPNAGNPRTGMKSDTWTQWYNAVNGAIRRAEADLTDAEEATREEQELETRLAILRMIENDEDPRKVNEAILQATESELIDPDKAGSLMNFNASRNENPVYQGILDEITARVNELGLVEWEAQRVLTAAEDEFLTWFNNETVQRDETGQWAYNMDTADRATQQKIAENIVLAAAPEAIRNEHRAAWAIREGEITPSQRASSAFRRDEGQIDEEERLLAAIQRDEYLGWESLPGETGDRVKEQLTTLWHGQAALFKDLTGFLPMNEEQLDDRGRPIYVQTDRRTGRPRYFRFRIPTDEEGNLQGGVIRGAFGGATANEILQVYNPADGLYYDVDVRPESESNQLGGNVRFNMRTDLPGWEP